MKLFLNYLDDRDLSHFMYAPHATCRHERTKKYRAHCIVQDGQGPVVLKDNDVFVFHSVGDADSSADKDDRLTEVVVH